jgi:hypothetical protein
MISVPLRLAVTAASAVLAGALLAGCGDGTNCSVDGCTVTFDRGVDASTSVLGVDVKLVGVKDNQVTVEAAGEQVEVPIGDTEAESNGLSFHVKEVTADKVVLKVTKN